jgi:hypothetical protein
VTEYLTRPDFCPIVPIQWPVAKFSFTSVFYSKFAKGMQVLEDSIR